MARDYENGDVIFDSHWLTMQRAVNGNGVVSGLVATAVGATPYRVSISSGEAYINDAKYTFGTTGITFTAPDPSYNKWVIVVAQAGGTILGYEGTPATRPIMPQIGTNELLICAVLMPPGMPDILDADIIDCRFHNTFLEHKNNTSNPHAVQHSQTGGITANDHHNQAHSLAGTDHTGTLPSSKITGGLAKQMLKTIGTTSMWSTISDALIVSNKISDNAPYTTIEDAIDDLPANGGIIVVLLGDSATLPYSLPARTIPSNTALIGENYPKVEVTGIQSFSGNLLVHGFDFSSSHATADIFRTDSAISMVIQNCIFTVLGDGQSISCGMSARGYALIQNNIFKSATATVGAQIRITLSVNAEVYIHQNDFSVSKVPIETFDPTSSYLTGRLIVTENIMHDHDCEQFFRMRHLGTLHNSIFSGNSINCGTYLDNTFWSIPLDTTAAFNFSRMERTIIKGNVINANKRAVNQMYVDGNNNEFSDNIVKTTSTLYVNNPGIALEYCNDTIICGNRVDCVLNGNSVVIAAGSRCIVSNNNIHNGQPHQTHIVLGGAGVAVGNILESGSAITNSGGQTANNLFV